jgi:hypothetical protein
VNPNTSNTVSNIVFRGYRGAPSNLGYMGVCTMTQHLVASRYIPTTHTGGASTIVLGHSLVVGVSSLLSYPLEAAFTRKSCSSPLATSMYKGFPLALASIPFRVSSSLGMMSFLSWIFPLPKSDQPASDLDYLRGFMVGGVSAAFGSVLVYPMDTMRRRMIVHDSSLSEAFKTGRLWRGVGVHTGKCFLECGLLGAAYIVSLRFSQ